MVIVDANVAVAWYVDLPWSEAARSLADRQDELLAPTLIVAETANALWRQLSRGGISEAHAIEALDHLAAAVTLVPDVTLRRDALRLASALRHPAYDCFYLALAQVRAAPLATADRPLARRAAEAGIDTQLLSG